MPTIIQSDKLASTHLGTAASFGLKVPSYLPDAFAAAYSLRKVRQAYTGPCLRVRNSTTAATADVAFDGYAISMASLVTVVAVGTSGYSIGQVVTLAAFAAANNVTVNYWYDQSGNGRNLATWTGDLTQQPSLIVAGVLNTQDGLPIVIFNGSSNRMEVNATVSVAWPKSQPFSVLAVGVTAPTGTSTMWDHKQTSVSSSAGSLLANSTAAPNNGPRAIYAGATLSDAGPVGTSDYSRKRCYAARYNGANSKVFVDSIETASGNAGTNAAEDFRIGSTFNSAMVATRLMEVLVLAEATTDMSALSQRVMAYYGML